MSGIRDFLLGFIGGGARSAAAGIEDEHLRKEEERLRLAEKAERDAERAEEQRRMAARDAAMTGFHDANILKARPQAEDVSIKVPLAGMLGAAPLETKFKVDNFKEVTPGSGFFQDQRRTPEYQDRQAAGRANFERTRALNDASLRLDPTELDTLRSSRSSTPQDVQRALEMQRERQRVSSEEEAEKGKSVAENLALLNSPRAKMIMRRGGLQPENVARNPMLMQQVMAQTVAREPERTGPTPDSPGVKLDKQMREATTYMEATDGDMGNALKEMVAQGYSEPEARRAIQGAANSMWAMQRADPEGYKYVIPRATGGFVQGAGAGGMAPAARPAWDKDGGVASRLGLNFDLPQ